MSLLDALLSKQDDSEVGKLNKIVDRIDALEEGMKALTDEELSNKTIEFKERLKHGETLDDLLEEAFAVAREATRRTLGMRQYRVQMIGGIVLHQGKIAEMKTGEGKTLVSVAPCYLNALKEEGVHVITVNDYLAERDADTVRPVFDLLGLTVGVIITGQDPNTRREQYNCDLSYGTNSEFGFDYLRDNMVKKFSEKVQRKLSFCIIDEVDSILIDEARTPLIISGEGDPISELYYRADDFIRTIGEEDFELDKKEHTVSLTESGFRKAENFFKIRTITNLNNMAIYHHINQALTAHKLMSIDDDYVVKDGEVFIVDEYTGRIMDGRRFSDGLHQALEAKEKVEIQLDNKTMATVTYQNFFRMYGKISGMTGTAKTEENEFEQTYHMNVVQIPTNKPVIRKDLDDKVYMTEKEKFDAVVEEIKQIHSTGQPILVGTATVEKSEYLSELLNKKNLKHEILNAKNDKREAEIVEKAGLLGNITIATNMAGRGTDIKLGNGDPKMEEEVISLGGLYVLGTERHESRRIDNQLRGRSGRQGDPGTSRFFVSIEDEIIKLYGGASIKKLGKKLKPDSHGAISSKSLTKAITNAQKGIEGRNFEQRKDVLKYDNVIDKQRKVIYAERDNVLKGIDLKNTVMDMAKQTVDEYVDKYINTKPRNYFKYMKALYSAFMPPETILIPGMSEMTPEEIGQFTMDIVNNVYNLKLMMVGEEFFSHEQKEILLRVVDTYWVDHIDLMDQMRQSVGLVAVGQKDPVKEYTIEAYEMFKALNKKIRLETLKFVFSFEGME
ncbi:MAG: preprotein translocase subunit SecA [Peptostreptococcus porci]|uniref:Protein translocase subunit SecA n=1 Tax=Peptostreptococcus porci TaxID=2652282 RepID=A0A6N7XF42_9FIRM|nr:preprotein translocase subunit SecA [Peptostreptococcus porci]MDY4560804.1 preprotein translocase subunit SecA [Peptostreptococcus porci]MDY5479451.1 preprotein translocase subunit SecA [Peptostreptococcus porci]MDY6231047.1 preprotein translocase subunit SecA [Peptostreptococcus porci]MST61809.1 preprotein translocase subunit SecA [Peptostreptococcus porci]